MRIEQRKTRKTKQKLVDSREVHRVGKDMEIPKGTQVRRAKREALKDWSGTKYREDIFREFDPGSG